MTGKEMGEVDKWVKGIPPMPTSEWASYMSTVLDRHVDEDEVREWFRRNRKRKK